MLKGVTLRGLEIFDALASCGSVAGAAARTGLSQPAVSQQLRNLEAALGTDLVDHTRRPMQLTAAGRSFLARTRRVLGELRLAQSDLTVMDLSHLATLTMGIIDDFDNDLTPQLVTALAETMTRCRFRLMTAPSHEINEAIGSGALDLAISASPNSVPNGLTEHPLIRDPFILVAPRGRVRSRETALADLESLTFLRYDRDQMIGRQIEAHLNKQGLSFPERYEVGSNPTLMSMVASGIGWAITTPLGYLRAVRFHETIDVFPLPQEPLTRQISLFASADWDTGIPSDVARTVQQIAQSQFIVPAIDRLPWLSESFQILAEG